MLQPIRKLVKKVGHSYASAGYPLLPLTRWVRAPLRWFYHRSPLLRHDARSYLKPKFLSRAHHWLIRDHPSDFLIYHRQIKFRSVGSLMSTQGYYVGEIEYHLLRFLTGRMKPGFVMLDVGAHHGVFTTVAAFELKARGWDGLIYSFEPNPQNFALLELNVGQNGLEKYVRLHQAAVSNADGPRQLLINTMDNSDNRLSSPRGLDENTEAIVPCEVASLCLDNLLSKLPPVNVVKIDVQGGEPDVLAGAEKLIARDRPVIIVEAVPGWDSSTRVKEFLLQHRYSLHGVDAQGRPCPPNSPDAYVSWDWIGLPE